MSQIQIQTQMATTHTHTHTHTHTRTCTRTRRACLLGALREGRVEVGVDEAGRGCLAGPVVAAAVVWDPRLQGLEDDPRLASIQDSKLLSAAQRERAAALIREVALDWAVCEVGAADIDRLNILHASHAAMHGALDRLQRASYDAILVDGDRFPAYLPAPGTPRALQDDGFVPSACVVEGDRHYLAIAAASVLAKTHRDALMRGPVHEAHPGYGFDRHVGYGTAQHLRALGELGPCEQHRRSFRPVREAQP